MMPIRAKARCRTAGIDTRAMADAVDVLPLRSVGCLPMVDTMAVTVRLHAALVSQDAWRDPAASRYRRHHRSGKRRAPARQAPAPSTVERPRIILVPALWPTRDVPWAGTFVRDRARRLRRPTIVAPTTFSEQMPLCYLRLGWRAVTAYDKVSSLEAHVLLPPGSIGVLAASACRVQRVVYAHGADVREMARQGPALYPDFCSTRRPAQCGRDEFAQQCDVCTRSWSGAGRHPASHQPHAISTVPSGSSQSRRSPPGPGSPRAVPDFDPDTVMQIARPFSLSGPRVEWTGHVREPDLSEHESVLTGPVCTGEATSRPSANPDYRPA